MEPKSPYLSATEKKEGLYMVSGFQQLIDTGSLTLLEAEKYCYLGESIL